VIGPVDDVLVMFVTIICVSDSKTRSTFEVMPLVNDTRKETSGGADSIVKLTL
jgi:hypothetical protein